MNATEMAQSAYTKSAMPIRSTRGIEIDAFSQITHRLAKEAKSGNYAALVAALHDNRKLWTILAADVADQGNQLPAETRARIFYLAEFTNLHTSRILTGAADTSALVEINSAIIQGLWQMGTAA